MENHATLVHHIHYFLYTFGQEHRNSLMADAGVGAGGRQSLGGVFKGTEAGRWGRMEDDVVKTGSAWSYLLKVAPKAFGGPTYEIFKEEVFTTTLLITQNIRAAGWLSRLSV